jgi:hypothetical protein
MVYTRSDFEARMKDIQNRAREISLKYGTLNSYDFFNELEERREAAQLEASRERIWRTQASVQETDLAQLMRQKARIQQSK